MDLSLVVYSREARRNPLHRPNDGMAFRYLCKHSCSKAGLRTQRMAASSWACRSRSPPPWYRPTHDRIASDLLFAPRCVSHTVQSCPPVLLYRGSSCCLGPLSVVDLPYWGRGSAALAKPLPPFRESCRCCPVPFDKDSAIPSLTD